MQAHREVDSLLLENTVVLSSSFKKEFSTVIFFFVNFVKLWGSKAVYLANLEQLMHDMLRSHNTPFNNKHSNLIETSNLVLLKQYETLNISIWILLFFNFKFIDCSFNF